MAKMEWTKEQKRIIDEQNSNILVSAAAGSGKTAVLVERIINLVKNHNEDIDKFLIVTFTNAAANGMKQKIQKSLIKAVESKDGNIKHLRKQLSLMPKAQISTIHSFCIDVVRKNFHIIGIDPNFRIGDPNEVDILLKESIDEVLEEAYAEAAPNFINLVESFTKNRGDSELVEIMKDMYHFILSFPYPLQWMRKSVDMLNMSANELKSSPWMEAVKENIGMLLEGASESIQSALKLSEDDDGPEPYREALIADIYNINELRRLLQNDFESFVNEIYRLNHPKLSALRGKAKEQCDLDKQTDVKELRDEYKKIIETVKKLIPNKTMAEFAGDINYMYSTMDALYDLIAKLADVFKDKKMEKSIADFSDVEHYALEILSNKDIGQVYRRKFNYIFIDEYQDSNRLQETLTEQIKRSNNVFMVGDVKQSIYRFRLADPGLFMEKYLLYEKDENIKTVNTRIDLMKNFRSRKQILDGINYIFKNIMTRKIGEIEYNEESYLNNGAVFEPTGNDSIELNIINKNTELEEVAEDEIKAMKTAEIEAKFAVQRIRELVQQRTYSTEQKSFRPIEYKDIVILLRSMSGWSDIYEQVFAEEGIPFYADGGDGYFETTEIQIITNLLKIIDNIRQDIPLLSVMRSPIGGFTTEELIAVRAMSPKSSYVDAFYTYMNSCDNYLSQKLIQFEKCIKDWKNRSKYQHLSDIIWEILMETGYYYFVGVLPKGAMRQANLRLLADKAYNFEKTSMRGLFNFLRYIEKLNVSKGDISTAKTLSENDNVVRLMSIHKSKGLEFPVVIMCGLNKKFNKRDMMQNIIKHKDYGIAPKYINPEQRIYKETFPRMSLKAITKIENLSEEMRILYVAMTRAADKLIMVGTVDRIESKVKKWKKGTGHYNIYSGESFMDWICSAIYTHRDCKVLRQVFDGDDNSFNADDLNSKWKVNIVKLYDMRNKNTEQSVNKDQRIKEIEEFKNMKNSPEYDEIQKRLNWKYSHVSSINIPSKLSVTDLKTLNEQKIEHIKYKLPYLKDMPLFKDGKDKFTNAEIGTITHFVMQHLDISEEMTEENIGRQIDEMTSKNLLTQNEAETVEVREIATFFGTDVGIRMQKSDTVKREIPFVIKKKANEIIKSVEDDDIVLVQGIIDCYFKEDDGIIIIDYKTDFVDNNNLKTIVKRYSPQIASYKEAVEEITTIKVKECYLYLFSIGKAIQM